MFQLNPLVLLGGFLGYLVSILASTALVLLFFRLNARMLPLDSNESQPKKRKSAILLFRWATDTELTSRLPSPPSPAPAVALGAATLSQAYLLRHAVFTIMAMVQDFLVVHGDNLFSRTSFYPFLRLVILSAFLMTVISALSVLSIRIAGSFFNKMTKGINEMEEIARGNLAVAILFALVLFSVTIILNEGIEDVTRALIPYSRAGVVRLP